MTDPLLASYEAVSYRSKPIAFAEPDSIAANALLHGITPPPPDRCRMLELGCAAGMNLVSVAFTSPKSQFVGIDLSPSHIESGKMLLSEMGLRNVTLEARGIETIGEDFGTFDYIVCHGVYSWVPPHVQDAILDVCRRSLAPNGIAYVSYNTYPGWHQREMVRNMLMFHDDPSLPPTDRIARARSFAAFLATPDRDDDSLYGRVLREELKQVAAERDAHFFHEQLEPYNTPIYFADFARRAAQHGLAYLGEAKPSTETHATARIRESLGENPDRNDRIRAEQYKDFLTGRTFRRTLLCHEELEPLAHPRAEAVQQLYLRSRALPVPPAPEDLERVPDVQSFRTPVPVTLTTNNPLVLGLLHTLSDVTPSVLSFSDVHQRVTDRLHELPDGEARTLADDPLALARAALECAPNALVELRALPSKIIARPGSRPKASGLARWQAIHTQEVTSPGHWMVELSGMEQFLIRFLDGSNDRRQLLRMTEQALTSGDLTVATRPSSEQIAGAMDDALANLARSGLIVA
jgi:methyltransferase-like protein/trans-aconitate methyltransferase